MANIKRIIDIEIILKKINNTISEQEEFFLKEWLEENTEHQQYFEKAKEYFENGSAFDDNIADSKLAWEKINAVGSKGNNWKRTIRLGTAIAAAISLIVALVYLFDSIEREATTVPIAKVEQIKPGEPKATLILGDGSSYDLSQGGAVNLKSGGVAINSQGTKIKYTENTKEEVQLIYNTLIIPKGGEYFLELSDGTKIWINSETTLKYPVQFVGNERNVELTGEAYFEVSHNENKPFHVVSGEQKVEVLGTQFNVSSYRDDEHIVTTLVEGKVNVYRTSSSQENQILLPNQQSIMNKRSGVITSKTVDPKNFIAWKSGAFHFQDQTFDAMVKILSRWYDIDIFYENENVRDIKFTGRFKRYDDFETVIKLIERTDEVKFKIKGKTVIIK
jgi:transmembrane sensor